ncbi:conserved hypothetical protein [Paraburkholderia atlantica]|uniref:Uncharacterized protein n=1 Tax=Paraburkholderia atlantica TaxID=2654982 RepID=D5WKH2_PARAM|nr:conserved hypothetical protein [Paraburkholderia atlantica]
MAAHGWIVNRFCMHTDRRTAARGAIVLAALNHALAGQALGRMKPPDFTEMDPAPPTGGH